MMRVRLVVNPHSRRGKQLGAAVRAALRQHNIEPVESFGDDNASAIVVAGGDGTLVRQIPRALALNVPIGIVPLGTFNDVARTLDIPLDIDGACAAIAAGHTRSVDIARVNDTYYLTEASVGISSRLARLQHSRDKQRFGILAVVASLFQAMRHARPFHADVLYDEKRERFRAVQLTVANSQRFGGIITVDDASIEDGWLDLYAVEIDSFFELFSVAGAIASARRRSRPGLHALRSTAFEVLTRRPHHITADGEPAGKTPARFEILRKALRVFAP